MSHVNNIIRRSGAFFAGILLGLAGVTPVFAATLEGQLTPSNLLLLGALILLGIGIALKVLERRRRLAEGSDSHDDDLRWWLNA